MTRTGETIAPGPARPEICAAGAGVYPCGVPEAAVQPRRLALHLLKFLDALFHLGEHANLPPEQGDTPRSALQARPRRSYLRRIR
jgi:hypothetical protein